MFSLRAVSSVVLAAAGSVAGCKADRPSASPSGPPVVTVTAN